MEMQCYNCDFINDIPEIIYDSTEILRCEQCEADLYIDNFYECDRCNSKFTVDFATCPNCYKLLHEVKVQETVNYTYVITQAQYDEAISYFENNAEIGLDTEGTALDPFENELLLIQIGDENQVFLFDYEWFDNLAKESFWQTSSRIFIIHNAKYDLKVIKHSLGIDIPNIYDTMLAERVLTCGLGYNNSLKAIVKKYLDIDLDKKIRMDFARFKRESLRTEIAGSHLEYAAADVMYLPYIKYMQEAELKHHDLLRIADIEFDVCKVVSKMELKGIFVDTDMWQSIITKCENGVHLINDQLNDYFASLGKDRNLYGDSAININSNKQIADIFKELGVVTESLGKKALAKIDHPLAKLLCDYKKYAKQLSSFGNSFLEFVRKSTSRVHPSFNQIGADTGRFSCTNPNLQQIPSATIDPEYRKCFRAPLGRKIVTCDYSQQELRLLASLSGDAKFIKFYEDGVDLHSATASMMFNIPIEKVEKETHRKVAKTINFGLAYGQGAKKLGETIGATEEEAAAMIEKYFSQFTFIRDWLGAAAENAQKLGYSKTLLGRKRFYRVPEQHDKEYKQVLSKIGRRGKNSPIQGSGADMVKIALILIDNRLQAAGLDAYLINTVHDEIVVEASEQDAEQALEILRESMVDAGKQLAANVPILAEGGVGDYWSH